MGLADALSVMLSGELSQHCQGSMRADAEGETLVVVGWVLGHHNEAVEVRVLSGEDVVIRAPVDVRRPDIVESFGDVPGAERSGFKLVLFATGLGSAQLQVRVTFADGTEIPLGLVSCEVNSRRNGVFSSRGRPGARAGDRVEWTALSPPAEREKVLYGKDEWLFLQNDPNDVIGQQEGRVRMTRRIRASWRRILRRRLTTIETVDADWIFLIAPDKNFVYPEYLPEGVAPVERRLVHEFLDLAESVGVPVSYSLDWLKEAKRSEDVYPRTDTHWSDRGAYVVYRALCHELNERGVKLDVIDDTTVRWSSPIVIGDLGLKTYPRLNSSTARAELMRQRSQLVFDNRVHNHGRVIVFEQDSGAGPTAVIFGESFAQNLLPFLKESCRRLVFVHTSMVVDEILDWERPDVVLSVPVERFLARVPEDTDALARLWATIARKVEIGRWSPEDEPFLQGIPRGAGYAFAGRGGIPWELQPTGPRSEA